MIFGLGQNYGAKLFPGSKFAFSAPGELRCKTIWGGFIIRNSRLKSGFFWPGLIDEHLCKGLGVSRLPEPVRVRGFGAPGLKKLAS